MAPPFDLVQAKRTHDEEQPLFTPRVISGIEANGRLHLGNYFGAIRQHIELQHEYPGETYWVLADCHALANLRDGYRLRTDSWDLILDFLALGVDPLKATFYRQSDMPQTFELAWVLSCLIAHSDLTRVGQYLESVGRDPRLPAGMLLYPVLMGADILGLRATTVPVGQDQLEHIGIARSCAERFNAGFECQLFPVPVARLNEASIVKGLDHRRMGRVNGNHLPLFATNTEIRSHLLQFANEINQEDHEGRHHPPPIIQWLQLVGGGDLAEAWGPVIRQPKGLRWAADEFCRLFICLMEPFRERRRDLERDPDSIEDILREGARTAREQVAETLSIVREYVGLGAYRRNHGA